MSWWSDKIQQKESKSWSDSARESAAAAKHGKGSINDSKTVVGPKRAPHVEKAKEKSILAHEATLTALKEGSKSSNSLAMHAHIEAAQQHSLAGNKYAGDYHEGLSKIHGGFNARRP